MGVPKFFRWLSERYPLIIQPYASPPTRETCQEHFKTDPPGYNDIREEAEQKDIEFNSDYNIPHASTTHPPDPLARCGLPPEIDRLYIDMNGLIHGSTHNDGATDDDMEFYVQARIVDGEVANPVAFRNLCYYIDRIVTDVAKPRELVYMAIDGVAPRAKLSQQRSRRYQSSREGEIAETIYSAHMARTREERKQMKLEADDDVGDEILSSNNLRSESYQDDHEAVNSNSSDVVEVTPGVFSGKFISEDTSYDIDSDSDDNEDVDDDEKRLFEPSLITPGTSFFKDCTDHIKHFIQYKLTNDPRWQHLTIIYSGPNVPGEGEHKIMQFIREQKAMDTYVPNMRHCIMGQDGDLIMLGLATHEPNLMLLREQILFRKDRQELYESGGIDSYIHNPNFEFLHMNVLRDYFALEFRTSNVVPDSPFDIERTIDDFVFLTFFIGNDFLPHMPSLDIRDEGLEFLFSVYRYVRQEWHNSGEAEPYLTKAGTIVSAERLETFFKWVGSHEGAYRGHKDRNKEEDDAILRRMDMRFNTNLSPTRQEQHLKESFDYNRYKEILEKTMKEKNDADTKASIINFSPVLSVDKEKAGTLLENHSDENIPDKDLKLYLNDYKGRYYADKFGYSPFEADKHIELRQAYIEGLVWVLKYYYEGCVSWDWYYPYHYGPMLSDLVNVKDLLANVSFEGRLGEPLRPFVQLLASLPASNAYMLPKPYRHLMTSTDSPIIDLYPSKFAIDMNGMRNPWEAVVLLPFVDATRLLDAVKDISLDSLPETDLDRNRIEEAQVWTKDSTMKRLVPAIGSSTIFQEIPECKAKSIEFPVSELVYTTTDPSRKKPCFQPYVSRDMLIPLPGYPTLRDGSVNCAASESLGINVHGSKSFFQTMVLYMNEYPMKDATFNVIADRYIGTIMYINYPHLTEAFVVGVSNAEKCIRGGEETATAYTSKQIKQRMSHYELTLKNLRFGLQWPGSGGISIDEAFLDKDAVMLTVRPFIELIEFPDGKVAKRFAKFEVDVPLCATSWKPVREDTRLVGLPSALEKDPYKYLVKHRNSTNLGKPKGKPNMASLVQKDEATATLLQKYKGSLARKILKRSHHTLTYRSEPAVGTIVPASRRLYTTSRHIHTADNAVRLRPHGRSGMLVLGAIIISSMLSLVQGTDIGHVFRAETRMPLALQYPAAVDCHKTDVELYDMEKPSSSPPPLEYLHGTTTLAFVFQGGIIVAVDSRASMGSFVGSKTTEKVLPINSRVLGTMAGGAADCSFWIRKLRAEALLYELQEGMSMPVSRVSSLLSNILYDYRGLKLSMGTMIAGFDSDSENAVPSLYYVDDSGMRVKGEMFSVGSGSTYALGILDTAADRVNLSTDEAIALGIKAIRHATFRDAMSGGFINVYLITPKDGWKLMFSEDVAQLQE